MNHIGSSVIVMTTGIWEVQAPLGVYCTRGIMCQGTGCDCRLELNCQGACFLYDHL